MLNENITLQTFTDYTLIIFSLKIYTKMVIVVVNGEITLDFYFLTGSHVFSDFPTMSMCYCVINKIK